MTVVYDLKCTLEFIPNDIPDPCALCGGVVTTPFVLYRHKAAVTFFCHECCTRMRKGLNAEAQRRREWISAERRAAAGDVGMRLGVQ